MSFLDHHYREIITKAVIGKGKKSVEDTDRITAPHRPSSILGCWIINHKYRANLVEKDKVEIRGTYDVNIWYSYNDNSKTEVVSERVEYCDYIPLSTRDKQHFGDKCDVLATVLQQPNCLECSIEAKGNKIKVDVEREFLVEVIGETKVVVKVDPKGNIMEEDDDKHYKISDEELDTIDTDFLDDLDKD